MDAGHDNRSLWAAADMGAAVSAMAAAYALRFGLLGGTDPMAGFGVHMLWAALFAPVFPLLYALLGVYSRPPETEAGPALGRALLGNALAVMLWIDVLFVFRAVDFSRWMALIWLLMLDLFSAARSLAARALSRGAPPIRVLVIGGGPAAEACCAHLRKDGRYLLRGVTDFGDDTEEKLRAAGAERAILVQGKDDSGLGDALRRCEEAGLRPYLLPSCGAYFGRRAYIEPLAGMGVVNLRRIALDDPGAEVVKRLGDVLGALALLLLTAPVMLAAAVGTRLTAEGSVLFAQERVGKDRKPFKMLKFRTMAADGPADGWTRRGDARRTPFGAFLRRYSLDELPQLWNVLRGEMSLVGPRPELPRYVERFRTEFPLYMVRHRVRPGMTGWAQIHGLRGDTPISERVDYDLYYIENWSPMLDLKILLMTPLHGIVNRQEPLIRRPRARRRRRRID
ncbi:MAG: exopolysaccharide biosynthesis polyprenyl glycosylphosphotransferase [Oscillospiraceae bacterium]|nr:exopolysaccharide biosynthesis polyprenyl glycosylphosphotransferase [Oscillospiraceae bacterium]